MTDKKLLVKINRNLKRAVAQTKARQTKRKFTPRQKIRLGIPD